MGTRRPWDRARATLVLAVLAFFLAVLAALGVFGWHAGVWLPLGLLLWAVTLIL